MKQTNTITRKTRIHRQYDRDDLLRLLFPEGFQHIDRGAHGVQITFPVPSGGDYSGMDLDVDAGTPLEVRFTITTKDTK